MPSFAKPWMRRGRGWYLTIDGKQIPLGKDRKAAFEEYHKIMNQPKERPKVKPSSVAAAIDAFLDWVQKHRRQKTYVWYQSRLQAFLDRYPSIQTGHLKPYHVQQWIDSAVGLV